MFLCSEAQTQLQVNIALQHYKSIKFSTDIHTDHWYIWSTVCSS